MTGRTIHKFALGHGSTTVPHGKVILVANQGGDMPTVWIEYWPTTSCRDEYIFIGTGHTVPDGVCHVGSAVCGPFVWHVYRRPI